MPKPILSYEKQVAFRDAFYFIVVCEGRHTEPNYFRFFEGISSRVKIVAVENIDGQTSPTKLIFNALEKEKELDASAARDQIWFVIDTDRWRHLIRDLRKECKNKTHWKVAQSNPCFEVWLFYHVKKEVPKLDFIHECNNWSPLVHSVFQNGFNPQLHPILIDIATQNAKAAYRAKGDTPEPGSTQVWQLAEKLLPLISGEIEELKERYPALR
jgi:hypothetical protein